VYGIVRTASAGWTDAPTIAALVAGVLNGVFVAGQRRAVRPLMPLRLFASRERAVAPTRASCSTARC
jgi:hypothetical protein